jgi:orotidine-5'-phosphate decarboxylase
MTRPSDRLIVALDTPALSPALRIARQLRGLARYVKIGSILFTAEGPAAIRRLRALGFEIFLDVKFHDIPSTVEKSCRAATAHRVALLTVHASGEPAMLEAAARGVRDEAVRRRLPRPRVLGVTVLTSVATSNAPAMRRRVKALARQAARAGLDGVVASAQEAALLRRQYARPFLIVCPGIRSGQAAHGDQARVATPAQAVASGADLLVVGRPITDARDPRAAAQQMLKEMEARA